MTYPVSDLTCAVCEETAESAEWLSECLECRRPFHLNPYNNRPGRDCGDALLGGESSGVETFCSDCLAAEQRAARAAMGPEGARAEAMVRSLHGDALQMPPAAPAPAEGRRRFRRVDGE
ncbi:MAG: hypothetical protein WD058_03255 [Dehalococcoidia bacterium]